MRKAFIALSEALTVLTGLGVLALWLA